MDEDFFLVFQEGKPVYDHDGDILIQRRVDGTQYYVSPECIGYSEDSQTETSEPQSSEMIEQRFGFPRDSQTGTRASEPQSSESMEQALGRSGDSHSRTCASEPQSPQSIVHDEHRCHWTHNDILKLIDLYSKNKSFFASSSIKNVKVWQKISNLIGTHTAQQCENKFKYLKSKYLKKKDNMSDRSSGHELYNFKYFKEMDSLFHTEPIVQPLSVASSSRDNFPVSTPSETEEQGDALDTTNNHNNNRPHRNIRLRNALVELTDVLKEAEVAKEKRYQAIVNIQKESLDSFKELMNKFLEKM